VRPWRTRRSHIADTSATLPASSGLRIWAVSGLIDDPYAVANEHLGGFFRIEAKDLAEAMDDVASRWPSARIGSIEVRPASEYPSAWKLLRHAARGFGAHEELARARCVIARPRLALAMGDDRRRDGPAGVSALITGAPDFLKFIDE